MLRTNNAARLQETVRGVETMTRFALAVLSLASGVYTYLGVRGLLDGTATFVFFAAIIYAAAVSVAIYAFWTFMLRFVPLVTQAGQRAALFLTMAVGCFMIMAMSSWLNAAALAGSAALEQHLSVNLEGYVADFDAAHANALAAQSLLPDVQRAAADLAAGFIAPAADGGSTDLVNRQDAVMGTVRDSVTAQSAALSAAADEILNQPKVAPHRFTPLSSAEAVLRYWSDFIPSWAGAISIDLLPVVLVLVLMIVHDAMRRESANVGDGETMTAGEMLRAMDLYRQLTGQPLVAPEAVAVVTPVEPVVTPEAPVVVATAEPPPSAAGPAPEKPAADATVTALDVTRKPSRT